MASNDDNDDSGFECYDHSEDKGVHVDVDKEMADSNKPTLALLPNRSESTTTERHMIGTVIPTCLDQTEYLNHRNGWAVYPISNTKIIFILFTGPTRKEAPKPILMTREGIESDHDPKDNDGYDENQ